MANHPNIADPHRWCLLPGTHLGDWGRPGDVRRCPHGRIQYGIEARGTVPCYWRDLHPVLTPWLYRRARRALAAAGQ